MKPKEIYERRHSADRMVAVMLLATLLGMFAAVWVFITSGWLPSLAFVLLSVIAFALSRVFELLSDLIGDIAHIEKMTEPESPGKIRPAK